MTIVNGAQSIGHSTRCTERTFANRSVLRIVTAALSLPIALAGCSTSYIAKPKFMREPYEEWVDKAQRRGMALLENALIKSDVVSLKDGAQILVLANVELGEETYCADKIARFDTYWSEYDLEDRVIRSCNYRYEDIHRLEAGDARLCSGIQCLANRVGM